MHLALEVVEKLNNELNDTKAKLKGKTDEATELRNQATLVETQMKAVKEHLQVGPGEHPPSQRRAHEGVGHEGQRCGPKECL